MRCATDQLNCAKSIYHLTNCVKIWSLALGLGLGLRLGLGLGLVLELGLGLGLCN